MTTTVSPTIEPQATAPTPGAANAGPAPDAAAAAAMIFIGGCPRSGTTLLRVILDSHPNIACGPEMRAVTALASLSANARRAMGGVLRDHYYIDEGQLNSTYARLIRSFLAPYHSRSGKKRIAEKTPANAVHFGELARLFPEAAFVQIIRDGRDVAASLLHMDWTDPRTGKPLLITTDAAQAAHGWAEHIRLGRAARDAGARYFEIRYEDIVREPRAALAPLFDFLGEAWSDDVLAFHHNKSAHSGESETSAGQVSRPLYDEAVGRWRRELTRPMRLAVNAHAGPMLKELGYARDDRWCAE